MAITGVKLFQTVMGDKIVGAHTVTGDASGTTYDVPLLKIDSAWYQHGTDTATDQKLSWSGNTVTFSTAISSSGTGILNYIGV